MNTILGDVGIGLLCLLGIAPVFMFLAILGTYLRMGKVVKLLEWQQQQIRNRRQRS